MYLHLANNFLYKKKIEFTQRRIKKDGFNDRRVDKDLSSVAVYFMTLAYVHSFIFR
jgi:hypothetical protein